MALMNAAQQLRHSLGIETMPDLVMSAKRASATKRGPGRVHQQGLEKDRRIKARPPMGFVLHRASAEKRLRRANVALVGIRRHKREERAARTSPLVAQLTA